MPNDFNEQGFTDSGSCFCVDPSFDAIEDNERAVVENIKRTGHL
jgi:hypothetical protein